jgi:hypothetical protein
MSRLGVKHGKQAQAEVVPTGAGGPHVLAGGHNRRYLGGQAWDTGGGGSGAGIQMLATPYYSRVLLRYLQMTMDRSFISIGRSR